MPLKVRTQSPPKFSDYRKYKPFLRMEFEHSCTYCDIREPELGGSQSFCIDHYRPVSKFPKWAVLYSNLLYACRHCNQWKGDYWHNRFKKVLGMEVLNPFIHSIQQHLDKSNWAWHGKTMQGTWNLDKFRLASNARIQQRRDRSNIEDTINILEKLLLASREGLNAANMAGNNSATSMFQVEIESLSTQIDTLKRKISGPMDS